MKKSMRLLNVIAGLFLGTIWTVTVVAQSPASTTIQEDPLVRIAGRYAVYYHDNAINPSQSDFRHDIPGISSGDPGNCVSGYALVKEDGAAATVEFTNTKTGKQYTLTSSSITCNENDYTIVLEGESPSVPSILYHPGDNDHYQPAVDPYH